ncbi:DUF2075 domain-containing protein [Pseudoroseomonas wenyumeiae]|uniref:DUF2075 domain-containing protein n=1 Tax=Teichococcus wenyumeiae TaxID=2478470 RepID=A0A3A9JHW1_9PROT|nr:DUF2075 domain-containing protein [Pseudoroseomonas wenyumeiae]RKK03236.1 DUF2075 domain-containing protein [Pseudoroseomonas wenyumeiae]RMI26648.1 DUF2075 domain-containing protein [Pseudoroseomonas wenyumeiae]
MRAWLACTGQELRAVAPEDLAAKLAVTQSRRFRGVEPEQIDSWTASLRSLRQAVMHPGGEHWHVLLEYDLLRLERRIDAVLLTDRAILVLEFKHGARSFHAEDLRQTEDYALDLRDFHAGSRAHPIVPVLVATHAPPPRNDWPLPLPGVTPVLRASATTLPDLVAQAQQHFMITTPPLDGEAWADAAYRPVPGIIDAARLMFARHGVEDIAAARADTANLTRTTAAIRHAVAEAREAGRRYVVFVTGIPGAGKTLCGLNVVFGEDETNAAFLTGNAPLVAVLREALARDARASQGRRQPARQGRGFLQNVHRFLEAHAGNAAPPPEHLVVFDEAQRAWDAAQATRDTQRRQSVLSVSEPAHMLEIMSRLPGWAVIVALVGNGQEINTGEAGLAEWGRVIAASGGAWQAVAAPRVLDATEPAQQLARSPAPPWLKLEPALDLTVPIRSVRDTAGAAWVDAVLSDRPAAAVEIAASADLPFYVTRDLAAARAALRRMARGLRRAGLVCSSGARRLRADGLGHVLHGPDEAVRWFLDRWPDVRASDALEVCATEYACQGLELDLVGLAWGGDFIRSGAGWQARAFAGTRWNLVQKEEEKLFIRNTYRVLMTRGRYETVLWVPPGEDADRTRPATEFDAIAAHLLACGARPLEMWRDEAAPALPPLLL